MEREDPRGLHPLQARAPRPRPGRRFCLRVRDRRARRAFNSVTRLCSRASPENSNAVSRPPTWSPSSMTFMEYEGAAHPRFPSPAWMRACPRSTRTHPLWTTNTTLGAGSVDSSASSGERHSRLRRACGDLANESANATVRSDLESALPLDDKRVLARPRAGGADHDRLSSEAAVGVSWISASSSNPRGEVLPSAGDCRATDSSWTARNRPLRR